MLLRKEKVAITAKHCCTTHGDTAVRELKFTDWSMKDNLNEDWQADISVNMHQMAHSLSFLNSHKQAHKVKRRRSVSVTEVRQNCWSALLVAELHKGGIISFRITQIKHALTVQIDFLERKQTFQNNDFRAPSKLGYFFSLCGLYVFLHCVNALEKKEIIYVYSFSTSQMGVWSYIKNGCWPRK